MFKQRLSLHNTTNCPHTANLSSFAVGTTLGWTSPISPKLKDPALTDSPLPAVPTTEEFAWIGSLLALAAFIGTCDRMAHDCVPYSSIKRH